MMSENKQRLSAAELDAIGKRASQAKVNSSDWRNLPIERWNIATFLAFIAEGTREKYGVDYAPGGGGSKAMRWNRERGMLKQAQGRYGNAVLRKFIEICWREYRTNKPAEFPYPTISFAMAYMDRYFAQAQAAIAAENRMANAKHAAEDLAEWL